MDSRMRAIVAIAAVGVASLASGSAVAGSGARTGSLSKHAWGTAIEVPGTAALNHGNAEITSVSCASAGNCSAGGHYLDSSHHSQAFVVSQVNGTWRTGIEVPGIAALNLGGQAAVSSVSCASAGNCTAGGFYQDSSGSQQAFVVSQVNGTWHRAIEVPGIAALNQDGYAQISSVSCASAGNCSAGGQYQDSSDHFPAFVISQVNGTWHRAIEVPGMATLEQGGGDGITSVSCASADNCAAGGQYQDSSGQFRAFVVSQAHGTWGTAIEVPGTAAHRGGAGTDSVSCASAGNCTAGGDYIDILSGGAGQAQAFVVSLVNGSWGRAKEVPGTAGLNQGGSAEVTSVSCPSVGNCSAGGGYADSSRHFQAFVVDEVNGTWHTAIEVPGTAALNHTHAVIKSMSCASAGDCSAGGFYARSRQFQAFVVSEK
jgi:hypothetical protein